jgi:predicted Zn-dependent protease
MVSDRFQSEFSPILRLALNDSEPAIRVQAASVVARIENDFLQRSVALKRMQIHGRSDMMLHRELAQYYATYAALGLLDPGRANAAMLEALDHYTIVLRENPKDPTIVEPIARLLLRLDRPDEAFQILKPWLAAGNISSCCAELYTEALFQLGKFADIRKFLQKHEHALRAESFDEQGRAAIGFWAQAARVHA